MTMVMMPWSYREVKRGPIARGVSSLSFLHRDSRGLSGNVLSLLEGEGLAQAFPPGFPPG